MSNGHTVTAGPNDTLCGIAVQNGFRDCRKLRDANPQFNTRELQAGDTVNIPELTPKSEPGQTEQHHRFRRHGRPTPSIRFVHGSAALSFENDPTLTNLNISRYVTDRAGNPDGSAAWVNETVRNFEANADRDPDTFKVELHHPRTRENDLTVDLEALRPVYDPADASGRRILRHERFTGAELARRSLNNVTASRQGSSNRFRTCYLRLVTDEADKNSQVGPLAPNTFPPQAGHAGRPQQTLLVTDMTDEGDPQVEILDQLVQASHTIQDCPGPADFRCRVRTRATIGTDRRRMRIAVHVLRQTPGGAPVVPLADAVRRVRRWFRRIYAQASIGPRIVLEREVDPVENLVAVGDAPPGGAANAGGRTASGVTTGGQPSQLGFRINATGHPSQVVGPINPAVGQTPLRSAQQLAALVQPPYTATVTQNPRRFNDAGRSADILIRAAGNAQVSIDQVVSTDTRQRLTVGDVNPLPNPQQSWDGFNFLVGSLHQRTLLKNYDSGDDRVDVFVINSMSAGNRGEAMMSGHDVAATGGDPAARAIPETRFSLFVIQNTMNAGDSDPLVLAHEIGHVAGELGHTPADVFQLMCDAVTGNSDTGGSKRIRNGNVNYNITPGSRNMNARLRSEGARLLEAW